MSDWLGGAKALLEKSSTPQATLNAVWYLIRHLEAQEQSQQSRPLALLSSETGDYEALTEDKVRQLLAEMFAPSSSAATPTPAETPLTLTISSSSLGGQLLLALTASQAATLSQFLREDTWVSCSLHLTPGEEQAAATGAIRISRDSIPPTGSASPSTEEAAPAASGPVGEC